MVEDRTFYESDIFLDKNNYEDDLRSIFTVIRPRWKGPSIQFQRCPGSGLLNITLLVTEENHPSDGVVVRIWDEVWDFVMNRDREKAATRVYNERRISPQIYCTFKNGVCIKYIEGRRYDWDEIAQEPISDVKVLKAVAREFAKFHSKKTSDLAISKYGDLLNSSQTELERMMGMIEKEWPPEFHDKDAEELFKAKYPGKCDLLTDWRRVMECLATSGVPVVLCHHDGHPSNALYVPEEDRAYFVDYEMSSFDYATFDLATYLEFSATGLSNIVAEPTRRHPVSVRKMFLREYLEMQRELGDLDHEVTNLDVDRLYVQTEKSVLAMWHYYSFMAICVASQPGAQSIPPIVWVTVACDEYTWINAHKEDILSMEIP